MGLPITDGVVTIREMQPGDAGVIVAGRDDVSRRFLGPGDPNPRPVAVIEVDRVVVGWVDHDDDRPWLAPDECNIGYHVFAEHRGHGFASRAVQLLLHHLAQDSQYSTASLLIDPGNQRSLALARRLGFPRAPDLDGNRLFKAPVPSLSPTDGVVTIRRQHVDDLDIDLAAKDEEQIRWLWLPGEREKWEAMTASEQREHARRGLTANHDAFGHGPKWTFAVDLVASGEEARTVAYVDVDLANDEVPAGEANLSYSCHPAFRRRGLTTRAARLAVAFVRDNTAAGEVHIIVDPDNSASLGVAQAIGRAAQLQSAATIVRGQTMHRHIITIER